MSIVTLTPSDMLLAAMAGSMRTVENMKRGGPQQEGISGSKWGDFQLDILGAMGELALCRHLGVDWPGKGRFRGPDAGQNLQVRCAERNGRVSLILYETDPDDAIFYCVRRFEHSNRFEVFQPIEAREGKQTQYWKADALRPGWFVPVVPV